MGETLSRHATHFLLMTATLHKGDPENYHRLVNRPDPHWTRLMINSDVAATGTLDNISREND